MKKRLISAGIGIALFVAVLYANNEYRLVFNCVISILCLISTWELFVATKYVKNKPLLITSMIFAAIVPFLRDSYFTIASKSAILAFIIALFIIMLLAKKEVSIEQVGLVFMLSTLVPFAFSTLVYLRNIGFDGQYGLAKRDGFFFIVSACAGAWLADTGAYFTGRLFGKHKLAPEISPKKTVEGFFGGVVFNVVGFIAGGLIYQEYFSANAHVNITAFATIGFLCAFAGTLGDLSASFIKRSCDIKDFGNIMPGHGGVLDRFDSVMLVAPLMYVMVEIFQNTAWPIISR